ncbi:fasciclin domain-containing protein [Longispora urticae]
MFRSRAVRLAAVAVAMPLMFSLAACGGDDTKDGNSMGTFGAACGAVPKDGAGSFDGMAKDPVATAASNNPVLSTLVAAVKAAGLVDTLNAAKDITVFAPTNDAFAKIPKADLDAVLADKEQLSKILTYHVVGQKIGPDKLGTAGPYKTLEGDDLKASGSGSDFTIGAGSKVVCGNVQTANATVYIVDTVLMPPAATKTATQFGAGCNAVPKDGAGSFAGMAKDPVATAASNNPALSTLVAAVKAAGLVDTLNGAKDVTVFAPTNDAFAKLPKADLDAVLANKELLTKILTYHVVGQKITPDKLGTAGPYKTLQGGDLKVAGSGTDFTVGTGAKVVCGNVQTANATVYIIDTVLMPA